MTGDEDLELADDSALVEAELVTQRHSGLRHADVGVEESVRPVRREQLEQASAKHVVAMTTEHGERRPVAVLVLEVDDAAGCVAHCRHPEERLVEVFQRRAEVLRVALATLVPIAAERNGGKYAE